MAVDFGDQGGFVWNENGQLHTMAMPEVSEINRLIGRLRPQVMVGENVHAFPGQGAVSAATFLRGVGRIEGLCLAWKVKLELIQPEEWVRWYEIGKRADFQRFSKKNRKMVTDTRAWKAHLQATGQKLFPSLDVQLPIADALLIWNYWNNPERIRKAKAPSFK
jgi:hypothetical protein